MRYFFFLLWLSRSNDIANCCLLEWYFISEVLNYTWFWGAAQLDLTKNLQWVFCECSRKDTRPPESPVLLPSSGMRRRLPVMSSAMPVTALDMPVCTCSLTVSPSFSPEFMKHCCFVLHPHLQHITGYLKYKLSLTTSYLNVNAILRKHVTLRTSAIAFEADIVICRWPDVLFLGG